MRMKYYLRGMGIGIMGSVLIFMVALIFYKPNLSDNEVIKRAEELGMVMADDQGTISEAQEEKTADDEVVYFGDDATDDNANLDPEVGTATSSTSTEPATSATKPEITVPIEEDETDSETTVSSNASTTVAGSVSIVGGDSSESVSRKLYNANLVENADDFNTYLVTHGYDRTLQNGDFDIPEGASYEDISRIITRKE